MNTSIKLEEKEARRSIQFCPQRRDAEQCLPARATRKACRSSWPRAPDAANLGKKHRLWTGSYRNGEKGESRGSIM